MTFGTAFVCGLAFWFAKAVFEGIDDALDVAFGDAIVDATAKLKNEIDKRREREVIVNDKIIGFRM